MKMKKKSFSLTIILLILLFSCKRTTPKPVVYTFYRGDPSIAKVNLFSTTIGKKVTELTGVILETSYPRSSDEAIEAGIIIAAKDYPDIIYGHNETNQFVAAGALIPLNDLIDKYGKNIKKYYGNLLNHFKNEAGIIYYIGANYELPDTRYGEAGFWLPIGLLQEAGWPRVESFDEYIRLIKEYAAKHPVINGKETIGFTALTESWRFFTLKNAPAFLMGYPNDAEIYVNPETFEAKLIQQAPFSARYFRVLNELWNAGLMDKEIFTQTYDQYLDKIASGAVIGFYDQTWQIQPALTKLIDQSNRDSFPLPFPVVFAGVNHESYNFVRAVATNTGAGISISCEDPEGVVRFWDRFLEDDIQTLINWGIEVIDYRIVEGKYVKNRSQILHIGNSIKGILQFKYGFPQRDEYSNLPNGSPLNPKRLPNFVTYQYKPFIREITEIYGVDSWQDIFDPSYVSPYGFGWDYQLTDDHPALAVKEKADSLTREHLNRVITVPTEKFAEAWAQFQQELNKIDVAVFTDFMTKTLRKRAENWDNPEFEN